MSPRAPITTGIVSVVMPHILIVSISWSLYFESFSVIFNEVFLSDSIVMSTSLQVLFLWLLITISGLLAAISLSVCIQCMSQSIVASSFPITVPGSLDLPTSRASKVELGARKIYTL